MPKIDLQSLIRSITAAASIARDVATVEKVPFLGQAASLSLSIVELINTMKSSQDENIELVQQIQELMSAVLSVYETTHIDGILPPAILYDIGKFSEVLSGIYSCLKAQKGIGKLTQFLKLSENEARLRSCKAELQYALDTFRVGAF
ncbi:hypothetical protein C8R44DRAFT_928388 [Mycena epipterygia]|nr:hypothetical protein C8R44DRAFT_928388 [Mycena epipterygia]